MSQFSHLYNDRKWRKLRARQLDIRPLCERCQAGGKVVVATVCDHIDPHKGDLVKFWAGPFQSLCKYHHDVKTVMEDGGLNSQGQAHPTWLPSPVCPVILLTGSPGSGKTTYAQQHATPADTIIDLDLCYLEVTGTHGHMCGSQHLGAALKVRNKHLANLASQHKGKAYVIVSSPSMKEASWWADTLKATHVRLDPGDAVCTARVAPQRQYLVRQWYAKAKANDWQLPKAQQSGCDATGLPLNPTHHWNVRATLEA